MSLSLKIVTPTKIVFEDSDIESASFPTSDGEITILTDHIPIVTKIIPGEIIIRKKGKESSLITTEGFLKLESNNEILLLADYAVRSDEIEIAKVQEAKKKAEQAMKEKLSQKDFAIAEAELRRTLLELKVSQRRKNPTIKI